MWYCYRSITGYRHDAAQSYRLGYATSSDGLSWTRRDDLPQFNAAADNWDSQMIAYPAIVDFENRRFLLYNGNGFGQSGFGLAELDAELAAD
jgi:hypothetical protein